MPKRLGVADLNRRTVNAREPCGDGGNGGDAVGRERSHGDHHGPENRPTDAAATLLPEQRPWIPSSTWRRRTFAAASILVEPARFHRDGDRVGTPEVGDAVARFRRLTAAMDDDPGRSVAAYVVAEVRQTPVTDRADGEQGTPLRCAAERDELLRDIRRDDSKIALHVAGRVTGRQTPGVRRGSRARAAAAFTATGMIPPSQRSVARDVARRDARRERRERAELLDGAVGAGWSTSSGVWLPRWRCRRASRPLRQ